MAEPVTVFDVAAYILGERGSMSTWKLQKLCYYSQAWSLVWDEMPLFEEQIEAWANGPVVPALYEKHRGYFTISKMRDGDPTKLSQDQKETIDIVLDSYGDKTGAELSALTHRERPWRATRRSAGLDIGERGNAVISHDDLIGYYSELLYDEES